MRRIGSPSRRVTQTSSRFALALLTISVAAFVGRAGYIMAFTRHLGAPGSKHQVTSTFDELYYQESAIGLAEGHAFEIPSYGLTASSEASHEPDATHPPMTVLLLAPVARLSSSRILAMRFAVALVGTGVVTLIGLIGFQIAGPRVGLLAATLAGVYPNLWINDGLVMSEAFAAFGTAAAVLLTLTLLRRPSAPLAGAVGVACAFAMLSRSELILLLPLLVVPTVLRQSQLTARRRFKLLGLVLLASTLTVVPWIGYNLSRFDEPVLLSHGDGGVLAGANCDQTYSGRLLGSWSGFCTLLNHKYELSVESAKQRRIAFRYMRGHWTRLPVVMAARLGRVWSVFRPYQMARDAMREGKPFPVSVVGWFSYWILVALALPGVASVRSRAHVLMSLAVPILIVSINAVLFYGLIRFRAPAEVSLVVLAAIGLNRLAELRAERADRTLPGTRVRPL